MKRKEHVTRGVLLEVFECSEDITHCHNEWDLVRVCKKKSLSTIRCRQCEYQCKVGVITRCPNFGPDGKCSLGTECQSFHVYPKKLTLSSRVLEHGGCLLEKVPVSIRPAPPTVTDSLYRLLAEDDESFPPLHWLSHATVNPSAPPEPVSEVYPAPPMATAPPLICTAGPCPPRLYVAPCYRLQT
eukprot:TRINITY_DN38866_c0_g1_i1.p1 TRINITY_DN38866_c0_g1~~TRINITY_DN38866_c0_g1_i1.p1  ORF type:complete len:185 (+),score=2.41 TRINITY_DN38866_c0_g1_i1:68-622(+)